MDKKLDLDSLGPILVVLFLVLFLMLGDCYCRYRQVGDMYVPFFLFLSGIPAILERVQKTNITAIEWKIWNLGIVVVCLSVMTFQGILGFSLFLNIQLGCALWLTIFSALLSSQVRFTAQTDLTKVIEDLWKLMGVGLCGWCLAAPWEYAEKTLTGYLVFISCYALYRSVLLQKNPHAVK